MNSAPKRAAIAAMADPPGAVVSREIASASMAAAPACANIRSTVLLPLPMPPVSPTRMAIRRSDGRPHTGCLGRSCQWSMALRATRDA